MEVNYLENIVYLCSAMKEHVSRVVEELNSRTDFRLWVLYFGAIFALWVPFCIITLVFCGGLKALLNLTNAAFVVLPFVFLGRKSRWTVLIPIWGIAIYFFTNLPYSRFFFEFMSLRDYFMFGNWDGITFKSGLALLKLKDFVLLVPACLYTVLYLVLVRSGRKSVGNARFSTRAKWIVTAVTIPAFVLSEIYMIRQMSQPTDSKAEEYYFGRQAFQFGALSEYRQTGNVTFFAKNIVRMVTEGLEDRTLTAAEADEISDFMRKHDGLVCPYDGPDNSGKNLIFIVVESLNSWVVNAVVDGNRVMPTLQALVDSASSVNSLEMKCQIILGASSDGQMMYNTGLYPATGTPTVIKYGDNDFNSLPKTFKSHGGKRAFEVISDKPGFWKHNVTTRSYGYDFYINDLDRIASANHTGTDEVIFSKALSVMDTVPRPFMAFITTISMHYPFRDDKIAIPEWISEADGMTPQMRNYLAVTNYFDTQLGAFLEQLKEMGLYDDSVIVIASDHNVPVDGVSDNDNLVFVALNTGIAYRSGHPMGQVDIYPTILDIMGYEDEYRGMGLSIFNPNHTGAIDRYGNIYGENSDSYDSLLRMSSPVANLIHRGNVRF